jgi:hypothetical protein
MGLRGRSCSLCASPELIRKVVTQGIAAGLSDQAIVNELQANGFQASRPGVNRHRHNCVLKPAQAIAQAAGKGKDVKEKRQEIVAAAEAGDLSPEHFLSLASLTSELHRAADRLNRASDTAEAGGQLAALAALVGQVHRNVETRAKLASVGGFAPARAGQAGAEAPLFSLTMIFGDGRTEKIEAVPERTIDMPQGRQVFDIPALTTVVGSDLASPLPDDEDV